MTSNDRRAHQQACEVTLRFPSPKEADHFKRVWSQTMERPHSSGVRMIDWSGHPSPDRGTYVYFIGHVVESI